MNGHHIWCNADYRKPANECQQCARLNASYPMEGMSGDELAAKYFPDVIKRENPSEKS